MVIVKARGDGVGAAAGDADGGGGVRSGAADLRRDDARRAHRRGGLAAAVQRDAASPRSPAPRCCSPRSASMACCRTRSRRGCARSACASRWAPAQARVVRLVLGEGLRLAAIGAAVGHRVRAGRRHGSCRDCSSARRRRACACSSAARVIMLATAARCRLAARTAGSAVDPIAVLRDAIIAVDERSSLRHPRAARAARFFRRCHPDAGARHRRQHRHLHRRQRGAACGRCRFASRISSCCCSSARRNFRP